MIDEIIEELKCAFSDEEHFLVKPIALVCGHSVCQKCIPDENYSHHDFFNILREY